MKAYTLRDPYATAIVYGSKRLIDSTWVPPKTLLGQRIAIHVSKYISYREREAVEAIVRRVGSAAFEQLVRLRMSDQPTPDMIIGVATLTRFIGGPTEAIRMGQADWFKGPMAHVLDDVRPVVPPVPARGRIHYWDVPQHVVDIILSRIKEPA